MSRILLDRRTVFFSLSLKEDSPIICNKTPLSTMYILSYVCIVMSLAAVFAFVGGGEGEINSEEVCTVTSL